ncbi:MAG: DUF5011 domain-containing protein [Clostridiales bacterium]|nr:DUF5011 domain-containing protein [Clostridiales bacterium]
MRRRRRNRIKRVVTFLLLSMIAILVVVLALIYFKPKVKKVVTVEAGSISIDPQEFVLNRNDRATFVTDLMELDLNKPGNYEVKIKVGNRVYYSALEVIDTTPPKARVVDQVIVKNDEVEALSFVTDIDDATDVTVSFKEKPDTATTGDKEVTLVLTDTSNNRTELKARFTVVDVEKSIQIEAGSVNNITINDFIKDNFRQGKFITDISNLNLSIPATNEIQIEVEGNPVTVYVEVVDTTPPRGRFTSLEVWQGEVVDAKRFVTDIRDMSPVEVYYKEEPDFSVLGEHQATIILEDASNNKLEQVVSYTVIKDTEPPKIIGASDKTVYIGESVSFRKGITVQDNKDDKVELNVDSTAVNLKKEGTYELIYSATDSSGNKTTRKVNVIVKKIVISEETVYQLADNVLAKITNDSMSKKDKAYAIYKWTKDNVGYTGTSDKTDWLKEAHRGFTEGVGDCFTYFAVAEALLTRAEIDRLMVTRVGGETRHYWHLINCGDGWYHFDTTRHKDGKDTFMLTEAEAEEYTRIRGNNYYVYDKTLYPDVE